MSQIQAVSGSIGTGASSETSATGTPNAALPEITPAISPGDVVTAALMELSTFLRKMQEGQRAVQRAHEKARIDEEKNEVQAMREKASAIRTSAYFAAGALGASAAFTGLAAATGPTDEEWANKISETPAERNFQGFAKVFDGESSLANRIGDAEAAEHDADATNARAMADQAQARVDEAKDRSKDLGELAAKALDAVRAVLQAQHSALMAIAGRV